MQGTLVACDSVKELPAMMLPSQGLIALPLRPMRQDLV
jgi:hypothetical protein